MVAVHTHPRPQNGSRHGRKAGDQADTGRATASAVMLTAADVADMLACSTKIIYRLVDRGAIPRPVRLGGMLRWHALRHTFGTHLSASGVHPRTAMAAMRHSRMELTMNYYTDPTLLDIAGAVNSLPAFGASSLADHNCAIPSDPVAFSSQINQREEKQAQ